MRVHADELAYARDYEKQLPFEGLTDEQLHRIMEKGRALHKWARAHSWFHNLLNLSLIGLIFVADWLILLTLPSLFLTPGEPTSWGRVLLAATVTGGLHSYLMYTMGVFSMHEGAAHHMVFLGRGRLASAGNFIASNLCRVIGGEPVYYSQSHMAHHAKFGTPEDAEFLNFILARRYWLTFLPFATFINYSDFIIHRPMHYTASRVASGVLGLAYQGTYMLLCARTYGAAFALITFLVLTPHVGFYLDRLRQFTEHNLLPLDNKNGSRNFGVGFWGLLVGGGPWGQPCHWSHHLVASLPWYQQIVLHRFIVGLLTPVQKEQFLLKPVVGFPMLWWRLIREPRRFAGHVAPGSAAR